MRGGIDLGGTKIQAVVVDGRSKVLGEHRIPTPKDAGEKGVIRALAEAITAASKAAGVEPSALDGVGVGSPGTVDAEAGTVASARNVISDWEAPVPVAATLGSEIGTAVHLGHDVRVGTMAEFRLGAGKPYKSVLGVFWGTGVGGGLVLNGRAWTGRHAAGEIGHMVIKRGGARCPCGRLGCMEAYSGRLAMEREARRRHKAGHKTKLFDIMRDRDRTQLTSGVWARALDRDDGMAKDLIERAIEALGSRRRLGMQPARRPGRDHRRRAGDAPWRGVCAPHREGDAPAPLRRPQSARRPRRRARRPGRRDRRGPARARGQGGQCRSRKLTTRSMRSIRRSGRAVAIITWCSSG